MFNKEDNAKRLDYCKLKAWHNSTKRNKMLRFFI